LAAYLAWSGPVPSPAGWFIAVLAAGHLATALGLVWLRGLRDETAQLALGLAVALYVAAAALLVEGAGLVIGWTLATLALGWAWARYQLPRAGYAAMAAGCLTASFIALLYISKWFEAIWDPPVQRHRSGNKLAPGALQ
jgi:hypothetical protein